MPVFWHSVVDVYACKNISSHHCPLLCHSYEHLSQPNTEIRRINAKMFDETKDSKDMFYYKELLNNIG